MITWNFNKSDELWQHDEFETVDECIKDAQENYDMKIGERIAIGTIQPYKVNIDIESMLEQLEEKAYDECGEVAEDWKISNEKYYTKEMEELKEKVTKLTYEYLEKIGEKPTFYKIDDIFTVVI